jgi:hypothetical protein
MVHVLEMWSDEYGSNDDVTGYSEVSRRRSVGNLVGVGRPVGE